MKLLVLATDYPQENISVALMYIHTRNKYYVQNGVDVTVLNFKAKENYNIDGVKVITLRDYENNKGNYDILVLHAPNIRNHYTFLKKYQSRFNNIVLYFHGHEVLKTKEVYPAPYDYMKKSAKTKMIFSGIYDIFKLEIWRKYFVKNLSRLHFVFVSYWMYDMFLKYIKINPALIECRKHIIYNSIGEDFENNNFNWQSEKDYDFITIRNYLDGSKYAIDIVTKIASMNPQYNFCVVGKGDFFKHYNKPDNLEWINKTLNHTEIIEFLNKSRCALIPTRTDAQGVMACEMASFGIPLITSDIDVCKEIFEGFDNVQYINNEAEEVYLDTIVEKFGYNKKKNMKYFKQNTICKEIELYRTLI